MTKVKWKTTEAFVNELTLKHLGKYNYSLVEYRTLRDKIKIICPEHGLFETRAESHFNGHGCRKCANAKDAERRRKTRDQFIRESIEIHGNRFDYSLVEYVDTSIKVKIRCSSHGVFEITPHAHLQGKKCRRCSTIEGKLKRTYTREEFIAKANNVHKNKYTYENLTYAGTNNKVIITCPVHGDFSQKATAHLQMNGCPKCNSSKGELKIIEYFEKNNIKYLPQYRNKKCRLKLPLPFDFKIETSGVFGLIEFNGQQHYRYFAKFQKRDGLELTKMRDEIKRIFCEDNGIPLLIIKYSEINKIDELIGNFIKLIQDKYLHD